MKKYLCLFLGFVAIVLPNISSGETSYREAIAPLESITDVSEKLDSLEVICLEHLWEEPFVADSLVALLKSEATKTKHKYHVGRALFFQGMLEYNWKNYDQAYKHYIEAQDYLQQLDSLRSLAEVYHNMALVHFELKDSAEFMKYINKARKINKTNGYYAQLMKNEFAVVNYTPTAEAKIARYVAIRDSSIKYGYDEGVLLADLNSGIISYHIGLYKQTLEFVENAEQIMQSTGITKYASELYEVKAAAYWIVLDLDKAEEYFKKAYVGYHKRGARMRMGEIYLNLGQVNQQRGNLDSAISYLLKYIALQDSIQIDNKSQIIKEAETRYKLEYKEKENDLLRKEAKLDEAKLEAVSRQRILLILLLVITLLAIVLLTARYYTKQKHVTEVENINTQLSSLNLEMESILQMVSHDFRTPLAKIKIAGELLQMKESNLEESSKAKLATINSSVAEAEQLVSDILEVKQFMTDDHKVLDPQIFDIEKEINGICQQFEQPVNLKHLALTYKHSGDSELFAVQEVIKRIVSNLVSNAVKFVPIRGEVKILSNYGGELLTIEVRDNGPGFTETEKQKVFQKFARFSNKPVEWGTSHGLGLFIVKKLVSRLGGNITLESETGKGAAFLVEIPVKQS